MKRLLGSVLAATLCLYLLSPEASAAELIPVGQVIGLELRDGSVSVAAFDETLGAAAKAAGIQIGDRIVDIDGMAVASAADVRTALERSDGRVELTVLRNGQEQAVHLNPLITADGPRLGISLRQGVTGLGTVTWYDPATGDFGALGHGVSNGRGELVKMVEGYAYDATVVSVKRGACGEPGQLRGGVDGDAVLGPLEKNTQQGIFGNIENHWNGRTCPAAKANQIREGKASILSTVSSDGVREYSVEILKIYPNSKCEGRNMLLRVTDPAPLEVTGGIVQGMSGSPIIQDGKLIGAVTHVLVNDPTTGYGIFIENMLDAAA
jgi:stage IV sporulation protein B